MRHTKTQVAWMVAAFCLAYFLAMAIPNALGARSETMLAATSVDEPVTYPYVVRMLTPASDLKDLFTRWVIYGDYHYGYPFYFLSAVVVLPVRLIYGALFTNHTALNLWLLRQLISVLPTLLAAAWLVYLHTRFEKAWASLGLLAVLLSIRAVVRSDIQWWHPDALSLLAIVLTLFFLQRDRLRFGRNFLLAAAACGVAAGIKLAGFFFAPAVALYLLAGLWRKALPPARAVLMGMAFLGVMAAALVVSNPFLYNRGAREEMVKIQAFKTEELDQGYSHDDPTYYAKGPGWWRWTLETWYAHPLVLGFLAFSLLSGCLWGPNRLLNRLILLWVVPYSIYLLYFVAVKPDHYWLPVMLLLFSTALDLPLALSTGRIPWLRSRPRLTRLAHLLVALLLVSWLAVNFARPYSGIVTRYSEALQVEQRYHP
jgi:hypothetical protein